MVTKVSDVVVPDIFSPYTQQLTEEKSRLIAAGGLVRSAALDLKLQEGGLTFQAPSFNDLLNEDENVSNDDDTANSTAKKILTSLEISVRMSRNQSWSTMDLSSALAGADPMESIAELVAGYWSRRLQAATVATMIGVFADNDAAPVGTEHVAGDLTNDISGAGYVAGVTDFSGDAFLDTLLTIGDSQEDLGMVFVHSVILNRMQKNDLIDFIPDSEGRVVIPTFLGRRVIVDDGIPKNGNVYETWVLGEGALQLGVSSPDMPTEVERSPSAGNGGGQETLYSRLEWAIHPVGHKYAGTAGIGGPSNAATANNLANAGSWQRVYPERKQIKIARLITREA